MKILHIIPQLGLGGAERIVVNLCNIFARQGHEVAIGIFFDSDVTANTFADELHPEVNVISFKKKTGLDLRLNAKIERYLDNFHPDVVHCHLRTLPYMFKSIIKHNDTRFIYTFHNAADFNKYGGLTNLYHLYERYLFKRKKVIPVTISGESDRSFALLHGEGINRRLIPNGSPPYICADSGIPDIIGTLRNAGNKVLVNVARITPQKNQLALIDAVRRLKNVTVLLIGASNNEYAKGLLANLPPNVLYLGEKRNPMDYVAAADAFILSSVVEGMPVALIESFATGTIPLVTPAGGMVDMVKDGVNGLVSRDCSAEAIREMITRFLSLSPPELDRIKAEARRSFEEYSIETCAGRYLDLYKNGL